MEFENEENFMETEEQFLLEPNKTNTKYVYVNTRVDYQYRSTSLDNMCLYDYVRVYRKKCMDANDRKQLEVHQTTKGTESNKPRRGRPPCEREPFQAGHPQVSSHINIKRSNPVVPVLIGPPIPRRDREDTRERYSRSILTLFFPWRSIQDLCSINQTWEQAFEIRRTKISNDCCKIIENIQLLQECKSDRDEHLQQVIEAVQTEVISDHVYASRSDSDSDDENNEILGVLETIDMCQIPSIKEVGNKAEEVYFEKTVQAVDQANRFANIQSKSYSVSKASSSIILCVASRIGSTKHLINAKNLNRQIEFDQKHLVPATNPLIQLNGKWQRRIKEEKERIRNASIVENMESESIEKNDSDANELIGTVDDSVASNFDTNNKHSHSTSIAPVTMITVSDEITREHIVQQFTLNKNQKAAFMIVTGHLDGLDRLNEGMLMKSKGQLFLYTHHFCR